MRREARTRRPGRMAWAGAGTVAAAVAVAILAVTRGGGDPPRPSEHGRAYDFCKTLMKDVYEQNRRIQRPDLTPAEFWRQVRFDELESDSVQVESLGNGVYRVEGGAERPARLRNGGRFYGRFICEVKESWSKAGPTTVIG